jgi:hypothetical protein
VRLQIHRDKTKSTRLNTNNREPITLGNTPLQEVDAINYLGSVINREGGTKEDVNTRIQKEEETKIRIFNTNVKTVVLYGLETWRTKAT